MRFLILFTLFFILTFKVSSQNYEPKNVTIYEIVEQDMSQFGASEDVVYYNVIFIKLMDLNNPDINSAHSIFLVIPVDGNVDDYINMLTEF